MLFPGRADSTKGLSNDSESLHAVRKFFKKAHVQIAEAFAAGVVFIKVPLATSDSHECGHGKVKVLCATWGS